MCIGKPARCTFCSRLTHRIVRLLTIMKRILHEIFVLFKAAGQENTRDFLRDAQLLFPNNCITHIPPVRRIHPAIEMPDLDQPAFFCASGLQAMPDGLQISAVFCGGYAVVAICFALAPEDKGMRRGKSWVFNQAFACRSRIAASCTKPSRHSCDDVPPRLADTPTTARPVSR